MFSFDTPPANRRRSFFTLFFVFSSASWPLFLRFHELSLFYFDFIMGVCSRGLPFWLFLGPLDATGAIQGFKTPETKMFF